MPHYYYRVLTKQNALTNKADFFFYLSKIQSISSLNHITYCCFPPISYDRVNYTAVVCSSNGHHHTTAVCICFVVYIFRTRIYIMIMILKVCKWVYESHIFKLWRKIWICDWSILRWSIRNSYWKSLNLLCTTAEYFGMAEKYKNFWQKKRSL